MDKEELRELLDFRLRHGWLSSRDILVVFCKIRLDLPRNLVSANIALSAARLSDDQVNDLIHKAFESESVTELVSWRNLRIDHDQRGYTTVQADGVVLNNNG